MVFETKSLSLKPLLLLFFFEFLLLALMLSALGYRDLSYLSC